MSTDFRRVRDIGDIDLDSIEPILAKDMVSKKDVILKQFDWGSCLHCNLKFRNSTDIDFTGDILYATFIVNNKIYKSKVIEDGTGSPLKVLCEHLGDGVVEVLLPSEVMREQGLVDMELVVIESNVYRITSPTIRFKIEKSISEIEPQFNANYIVDDGGNHIIWN